MVPLANSMRRCGKSSISRRLLATDKRFKLMSLDDLIVYEAQGSSIPKIVEDRGWPGFRDLEHEVTRMGCRRNNLNFLMLVFNPIGSSLPQ